MGVRLRAVQVRSVGPSQSEDSIPSTLRENEAGVDRIEELPNGQVRVYGKRSTFKFWPANVVWGEELVPVASGASAGEDAAVVVAPLSPTQPALASDDNLQPDQSDVAQLAEQVPVKHQDESSSPSVGADEAPTANKRPKRRGRPPKVKKND